LNSFIQFPETAPMSFNPDKSYTIKQQLMCFELIDLKQLTY